jgi:hypothetical protein
LLSTHAIGSVRLLLGSLVLLIAGAGLYWLMGGPSGTTALVIRGGALEIESWDGELRSEGADVYWDHAVSDVSLSIYKAEDSQQEFDLGEPIRQTAVKSLRINFRVDGARLVEQAVVITFEDRAVKITSKPSQLARRGDVWVYPGFMQSGRRMPFEIASLELLGQDGQVISRYQNPDMGRRFRYRIKLTASSVR